MLNLTAGIALYRLSKKVYFIQIEKPSIDFAETWRKSYYRHEELEIRLKRR